MSRPQVYDSRRNSKFKSPEVEVCLTFVEKQQGNQCGENRVREEKRDRRGSQVGKRGGRSLRAS